MAEREREGAPPARNGRDPGPGFPNWPLALVGEVARMRALQEKAQDLRSEADAPGPSAFLVFICGHGCYRLAP